MGSGWLSIVDFTLYGPYRAEFASAYPLSYLEAFGTGASTSFWRNPSVAPVFHGLLYQPAVHGLKCVLFRLVVYFNKLRGGVSSNLRFATVLTHSLTPSLPSPSSASS